MIGDWGLRAYCENGWANLQAGEIGASISQMRRAAGTRLPDDFRAMELLATFPTVQSSGVAQSRDESMSSAAASPRSSRSITILAVIAMVTWAAVWWLERQHDFGRQPAAMAASDGVGEESVTR